MRAIGIAIFFISICSLALTTGPELPGLNYQNLADKIRCKDVVKRQEAAINKFKATIYQSAERESINFSETCVELLLELQGCKLSRMEKPIRFLRVTGRFRDVSDVLIDRLRWEEVRILQTNNLHLIPWERCKNIEELDIIIASGTNLEVADSRGLATALSRISSFSMAIGSFSNNPGPTFHAHLKVRNFFFEWAYLICHPGLQTLRLASLPIFDQMARHCGALSSLEELNIQDCASNNTDLIFLKSIPNSNQVKKFRFIDKSGVNRQLLKPLLLPNVRYFSWRSGAETLSSFFYSSITPEIRSEKFVTQKDPDTGDVVGYHTDQLKSCLPQLTLTKLKTLDEIFKKHVKNQEGLVSLTISHHPHLVFKFGTDARSMWS